MENEDPNRKIATIKIRIYSYGRSNVHPYLQRLTRHDFKQGRKRGRAGFLDEKTVLGALCQLGEGVGFDIDINDYAVIVVNLPGHLVRQVGGAGGTDNHQQCCLPGSAQRAVKVIVVFVIAFIKQKNMWSGPCTTEWAAQVLTITIGETFLLCLGLYRIGNGVNILAAFKRTSHIKDVAVNLIGARKGIAGPEVEPIDILGNKGEPVPEKLFHAHKCVVTRIGLCRTADTHAVEVPSPDLIGHLAEHVKGGHLLGLIYF